jgi:hypothetical protein
VTLELENDHKYLRPLRYALMYGSIPKALSEALGGPVEVLSVENAVPLVDVAFDVMELEEKTDPDGAGELSAADAVEELCLLSERAEFAIRCCLPKVCFGGRRP